MNKIIAIVLALFLVGCGGSTPVSQADEVSEINVDDTTEIKGTEEENIVYEADENGKITTIALPGSSEDIAVSKDALFVAKGEDGIDIVKIGYNDKITSELITAIGGINAKSVSLSDDGDKIHVVNEEGYVNIIDITNLSNPVKERVTTQQEIEKFRLSQDENYKYIPRDEKGLEIYDVSNPSTPELLTTFNKSSVYDLVLVDKDSKALLAAGVTGMNLLDITTPSQPNMIVNFSVPGGTKGLSLNEEKGLLFVANGDKGVLVYYLNSVLDKLSQ